MRGSGPGEVVKVPAVCPLWDLAQSTVGEETGERERGREREKEGERGGERKREGEKERERWRKGEGKRESLTQGNANTGNAHISMYVFCLILRG